MTVYKAQGQSMKTTMVDIESCSGTESPYVMVSRVTSLSGLLILRPFQLKKIQCRQSEDMRNEKNI
ncbi:hypothetical protein F5051DRAFT_400738 [Lentinula edodes]|nr:hypothetical protein F5051DRAFT_400738 [Lentinula edodes]